MGAETGVLVYLMASVWFRRRPLCPVRLHPV